MKTLENVYKLYVRPHLEYGDLVFDSHDMNKPMTFNLLNSKDDISKEIESIQYQAARIVSGAWNKSKISELYGILGWESLQDRRTMRKLVLLHQTLHTKKPSYLYYILTNQLHTNPRLAATLNLKNIHCKTTKYNKSYFPSTILDWNNLPFELKSVKSKKILKSRFLNKIKTQKITIR